MGALAGPVLGDVEVYGFAMVFPTTFIMLLRGMWKGMHAARKWMESLVMAAIIYLIFPGHAYVLDV